MSKFSILINSVSVAVSFFCLFHCALVILVLAGILTSNLILIKVFEDPNNHALLIGSGLFFAALSLVKLDFFHFKKKRFLDLKGLKSQQFLVGGSMLSLSFLLSEVYSELFIIAGALTLLNMHVTKLLRIK